MLRTYDLLKRVVGLIRPTGPLCDLLTPEKYRELLAKGIRVVFASRMTLPSNFTNDDLVAIYWYTHQNTKPYTYKSLNAVMWGEPRPLKKELLELSSHLTIALEKLPPFNGVCWRTAVFDVTRQLAHPEGTVVQYPAFTSTSSQNRKQPKNGGSYMVIMSSTGRDISGLSRFPNEAEILMLPGTNFRILTNELDSGTRVILMEEV